MDVVDRDAIKELQSQVQHNRIANIDELNVAIQNTGLDIDAYEDVLGPMGYNTCDRCGDIEDSEVGLFWIDGVDWDVDNPNDQAILEGISQEEVDYCAICWDCLEELKELGNDKL